MVNASTSGWLLKLLWLPLVLGLFGCQSQPKLDLTSPQTYFIRSKPLLDNCVSIRDARDQALMSAEVMGGTLRVADGDMSPSPAVAVACGLTEGIQRGRFDRRSIEALKSMPLELANFQVLITNANIEAVSPNVPGIMLAEGVAKEVQKRLFGKTKVRVILGLDVGDRRFYIDEYQTFSASLPTNAAESVLDDVFSLLAKRMAATFDAN